MSQKYKSKKLRLRFFNADWMSIYLMTKYNLSPIIMHNGRVIVLIACIGTRREWRAVSFGREGAGDHLLVCWVEAGRAADRDTDGARLTATGIRSDSTGKYECSPKTGPVDLITPSKNHIYFNQTQIIIF